MAVALLSGQCTLQHHKNCPKCDIQGLDLAPKFPISQSNQASLEAPLRIRSSSDLSRHEPLGMSCGVWYQSVDGRSVGSCVLWGRASMDRTCSGMSYGSSIGLGTGDFGGHFDALSSLSHSSSHPWTVLAVWQGELSWEEGYSSITECRCHEGMCMVCNNIWVPSPVHSLLIFGKPLPSNIFTKPVVSFLVKIWLLFSVCLWFEKGAKKRKLL